MLRLLGVLIVALPVAPPLLAAERPEATPDAPQVAAEEKSVHGLITESTLDFHPDLLLLFLLHIFVLAGLAFWLWMLVDAATRCPAERNQNVIWVLIVILLGPVGAFVYAIVQRPRNPPAST